MKFTRRLILGVGLAAGFGVAASAFTQPAMAEFTPKKPIEFVIMAGEGGGADKLARFIQSIVEKHKLSPVPLIPINKGGGSGAEALRYLKDKKGDDHVIMATLNSYYTTPLRNPGIGVDITEFTPVARLAEDTFILWVSSDSDIKSVEDYIKTVKEKGAEWKMGGTGTGQEDSLVTAMLEKAYGLKMTYVPYKGGGAVAKDLVGGHVQSTVNNPSEQMGFFQAGKSRPLAAFTPEPIAGFEKVPTFASLGKQDMNYFMQRSVVAPGGISKEAADWYVNLFKKVYDSSEWQDYCKKQALQCAWLTGDKLQSYFQTEKKVHEALLKDMGEIK
ncbi:MAG: Bug family tripartite tricarboxylate transporter substrate binding protein [Hyphomicrobiales bacterium]